MTVVKMYLTLMPTLISGILTMIWCKLPILFFLKKPIDGGKNWRDRKRIFGDNKTWYGFTGYLIINTLVAVLWGKIAELFPFFERNNYFYLQYKNTLEYNMLIGFLLGSAYSLFELPNSFLKRRAGIIPGKRGRGKYRLLFTLLDQADSLIGCTLVVWLMYDIGIKIFFGFIILGSLTHILVNILLYRLHLRDNMI